VAYGGHFGRVFTRRGGCRPAQAIRTLERLAVILMIKPRAARTIRGVTREARTAQFPGRPVTMGASNHCGVRRKVPAMSRVLSSIAWYNPTAELRSLYWRLCGDHSVLAPGTADLVAPLRTLERRQYRARTRIYWFDFSWQNIFSWTHW